jgi:hypothetical protein
MDMETTLASIENKLTRIEGSLIRVVDYFNTELQQHQTNGSRMARHSSRKRQREESTRRETTTKECPIFYCDTPIVIELHAGNKKYPSTTCILLGWERWMYVQPIPTQSSNRCGPHFAIRAADIQTPQGVTKTNKETFFQPGTMPKDLKDLQAKHPNANQWQGRLTKDQFYALLPNSSKVAPSTPPPTVHTPIRPEPTNTNVHPTTIGKPAMVATAQQQPTDLDKHQDIPIDIDGGLECPILE